MKVTNLLSVTNQADLIAWLDEHHDTADCCWVITSIKPEPGKTRYLDAVEAALCFGWIDGIKKKISPTETAQRLSPRSKKSSWTELNKARVRRLHKLGMMRQSGLDALPEMDPQQFQIDDQILQAIGSSKMRLAYFETLPELYKRIRIDNIQFARDTPELYHKRLDKFLTSLDEQTMYGQWNDEGRLLN